MKKMKRNVDYQFENEMAITLRPSDVCEGHSSESGSEYSRTHESGWKIRGTISEDYYYWVNSFIATHPVYGQVIGNFEEEVFATSLKGFRHFYKHHAPEIWDYMDI